VKAIGFMQALNSHYHTTTNRSWMVSWRAVRQFGTSPGERIRTSNFLFPSCGCQVVQRARRFG
jgi:hypothetical protein